MSEPAPLDPSLRAARRGVFALTWLSYATYYFARKNFPVAKARIAAELGVSTAALAVIDTGYLVAYAVGQFTAGPIGDRLGARRLIGAGMVLSALCCAAFGAAGAVPLFVLFGTLNGLAQATGWPGNVKAMAAWYGKEERGKVMGLWTTCFQVGPLVATALAAWLLKHFGWRSAFFGPALWTALVGAGVWLLLRESPDGAVEAGGVQRALPDPPEVVAAARRAALANPIVWLLGASYFGMKLIRYCIDFWQPFYLERGLGYASDTSAYASTAFQFGGMFGAVIVGAVSDKWFSQRRGAVATVMTVLLAGALALYAVVAPWGLWVNVAAMALVGFCLFGPDALISGVAAQDLGGKHASATVAGVINGCGSVGAIAQGALVAGVSARYGWQSVFQALMALAAISSVALLVVWVLQRRQERRVAA